MRDTTRRLRAELDADLCRMRQHNNSKAGRRTAEQNEQSRADRVRHFTHKWTRLMNEAETAAQKAYCETALDAVNSIR